MNTIDFTNGRHGRRCAALLCSLLTAAALTSCQTLDSAPKAEAKPAPAAKGKAAPPPKRVSMSKPVIAESDAIYKKHKDIRGDIGPGGVEACEFLERAAKGAKKKGFTSYEIAQLWESYTSKAQNLFRDDLFQNLI